MAQIRNILTALSALALGVALATPALRAQDAGTPAAEAQEQPAAEGGAAAPGIDFHPGLEEEPAFGEDYVAATHGAWEVRCIRTQDGFDPCRIYQLLLDQAGNAVAEFALVALPQGSEATAGATVITPLETLLTANLRLAIDAGRAKPYPFTWCSQIGCFSRLGFTSDEVTALKNGRSAVVTIVPVVAPDQQVQLTLSLSGFTAAYNEMEATNAATQKRAEEAEAAAGGN